MVLTIGLAGASLFIGDAMITPAISVLSAIEGLQIVTPVFKPYVVDFSDDHITGAGSVGVWTKADSVTAFSEFAYQAARP